jgi:hypothetical protein
MRWHRGTGERLELSESVWPELAYPKWRDTAATLQLWTQIVGKVRLTLTPRAGNILPILTNSI